MRLRRTISPDPNKEHPAENRKVGSSIPSLPTTLGAIAEARMVRKRTGHGSLAASFLLTEGSNRRIQAKATRGAQADGP